ncbi:hypothetical protein JW890_07035 [candidate division WOR-3 bacterium]|nr:hypothetical protein [candidate division WOR-3 bacterium]
MPDESAEVLIKEYIPMKSFWMKSCAILEIIFGTLMCFFPLTVVFGVLQIISGSQLFSASGSLAAVPEGNKNLRHLPPDIERHFKYKTLLYLLLLLSFACLLWLSIMLFSALAGVFSGISYEFSSGLHNFWQY